MSSTRARSLTKNTPGFLLLPCSIARRVSILIPARPASSSWVRLTASRRAFSRSESLALLCAISGVIGRRPIAKLYQDSYRHRVVHGRDRLVHPLTDGRDTTRKTAVRRSGGYSDSRHWCPCAWHSPDHYDAAMSGRHASARLHSTREYGTPPVLRSLDEMISAH
jgi:hypothetical protein